jgi:SsrA-binding protein
LSNAKDSDRYREIRNARAFRDYFIEEKYEAGIILTGTEVKSIRAGLAQIGDAFVRLDLDTPILYQAHIAEYAFGTFNNHKPYNPRKLLLHKREVRKIRQAIQSGGHTVVPLRMYFKGSLVKVEIAVAKGKKLYDKRDDMKKAISERELSRVKANRR